MPNLLAPPSWKKPTVNGFKYKDKIPEGYFLEQFCILAARLNDINLSLQDFQGTVLELIKTLEET